VQRHRKGLGDRAYVWGNSIRQLVQLAHGHRNALGERAGTL
jgi:hypothetical protein